MIANQEYYRGLHRDLKERAADALLGEFEKLGVRFLGVSEKRRFFELEYDSTIERIKQALRERSYTTPPIDIDDTEAPGGISGSSRSRRSSEQERLEPTRNGKKHIATELFPIARRYSEKGKTRKSPVDLTEDSSVHVDKKQRIGESDDEASFSTAVGGAIVKKFLSVGHFVNRFQEDDKEEEKADESVPALYELRRAFRENDSSVASPEGETCVASKPRGEETDVEHLAQIYKPSPLRTIKRGTRTPIPIFFQGV